MTPFEDLSPKYLNESDQRFTRETLARELTRKKERIKGAVGPTVSDIMIDVGRMSVGSKLDVVSTVEGKNGQPRVYLTITNLRAGVYTLFTHYIELDNHVRGPCLGIGEIPATAGMMFMALGGNSQPPPNGFSLRKRRPFF